MIEEREALVLSLVLQAFDECDIVVHFFLIRLCFPIAFLIRVLRSIMTHDASL